MSTQFEHSSFFPDEALDPESLSDDDTAPANGYGRFVKRLQEEAVAITGREKIGLTKQEESRLACLIQQGIAASDTRDKIGDKYDGSLDNYISSGEQARHELVTANLPFAVFLCS